MSKSGRPVGKRGKAQVFSNEDQAAIFASVNNGKNAERDSALLSLSFFLGLRVGEMAQINVSSIFDEEYNIRPALILGTDIETKGEKHRVIGLKGKSIRPHLLRYIAFLNKDTPTSPERPLFISQKKARYSSNTLSRHIKNIYTKAGFEDATSHSGRRSLITGLSGKVDINILRQLAGHTSIVTTQKYIDDNPALVSDALAEFT